MFYVTNLGFVCGIKVNINNLNEDIVELNKQIYSQQNKINQFNLDQEELSFLRLNLSYGHKCRKSFLNMNGYLVGTSDYKNCVLNRGKINE